MFIFHQKVKSIMKAVTIPVMAKCRIGHFAEAQILQSLGVDFIDESEGAFVSLSLRIYKRGVERYGVNFLGKTIKIVLKINVLLLDEM